MFPDKVKITDELIKLIINTRKKHDLTAYQLSEKIGKNKSWLPNIENKRTKSILKEDLLFLFKDFARDENLDSEDFIIKHLSPNANIELDNDVTVPNYYLQSKRDLFPPNHENLDVSEIQKRVFYHLAEKPAEIDLAVLEGKLKDYSDIITNEFTCCSSSDERESIIKMVEIMHDNFIGNFEYTKKLYQTTLFHGDPKLFGKETCQTFLYEINKIYHSFLVSYDYEYKKAELDSFFENKESSGNIFTIIKTVTPNTTYDSKSDILFEIEYLNEKLYIFILAAIEKSNMASFNGDIDLTYAFENIVSLISTFIQNAGIDYTFDYNVPLATSSLDDLKEQCSKINYILFTIKQLLRS